MTRIFPLRQYSKKWLSWNWKICHLVDKFIQSNYYLLKFSSYFLLPILKKFKSYREFQENSHRGDLQNPFTWKTRQFGESNMNLNIPAKQSRYLQSVTGNYTYMHGLEIQRVLHTYCWCPVVNIFLIFLVYK